MDALSYLGDLINDNKGLIIAGLGGIASAGLMYARTPYDTFDYPISLEKQSIEIEPGVRVSAFCKDGKLLSYIYEDAKTLYEAFTRGIRISNNGEFLGSRTDQSDDYEWIRYQEAYDRAQQFGSGMLELGLTPGDESFVGIYCPNRPEWVICKEACSMFSMVYVPLYDTLGPDACTYIINHTSMRAVICDSMKRARDMIQNAPKSPDLRYIIVINDFEDGNLEDARKYNIKVLSYEQMMFMGKKKLQEPIPPQPHNVACVCYTSGTTGNPKGVLLTHENLIANTAAVNKLVPSHMSVTKDDTHISYLPLAHMFEACVQLMLIQHGGRIGFTRGDIRLLTEDMQVLKPTIFPTVPRLLNRICDKVMQGAAQSKVKSYLLDLALRKKTELLMQGVFTRDSIWDKLVFHKVQALMGGRVRFSIVGSAPLSASVLNFTRAALGCLVLEGYGQTESTAGITVTLPHEAEAGQVGPPLACNKVKLIDVPEMDYYAKDGKGEVCVQGTNVMKGYYKEPEKTREAMEDGWLHTGDIGMWLPNGTLKIIDRRKHIFKLAQGEYLAPERIEGIYVRSSLIAQAFVDGDSLQMYPVGIIVPDPEVVPKWASENLGLSGTIEQLCQEEGLKRAILDDMTKLGKEAGLKGFEQVKNITLVAEPFSVENGLLTPTFKSKRPALRKEFSAQIEEMYKAST